jgi:hypothetical protein
MEELGIFVERLTHFMNIWTVYKDLLSGHYVPSVGTLDWSPTDARLTAMLVVYAYFYSLIETDEQGVNGFRIMREAFPEELSAINAVEKQTAPFMDDLRVFRNRLGFHGSRSRNHERQGFELFANFNGNELWNSILNFKALAATLLAKEIAIRKSDEAQTDFAKQRIAFIEQRAIAQTAT